MNQEAPSSNLASRIEMEKTKSAVYYNDKKKEKKKVSQWQKNSSDICPE